MAINTKRTPITQRKPSKERVNHAKYLLEIAESELESPDGFLISIEGLERLRFKVKRFQMAKY